MTDEFARVLAQDPDLVAAILRDHAAGPDGKCPKCRGGGDQSGRVVSPCRLLLAAKEAKRLGRRVWRPGR